MDDDVALTEVAIRKAEPKEKRYRLFDGNGLYLEIAPSGGKWWRLKYQYGGRERRISLGTYPAVGLKQAREMRDIKRAQVALGEDPAQKRVQAQVKAQASLDSAFALVAAEWYEKKKKGWTERYAASVRHRLDKYLLPRLGARPIDEIKAPELLLIAREIEQRGATFLSSRMMQIAGRIFRYGMASGRCEYDPTPGLRGALETHVGKHQPAVKVHELPQLMAAIAGYGIDQPGEESTRLGLQLLALTFVRTRELIESTWSEFDLERAMWKIDAPRMKMKREHWVPLSQPALGILARLKVIGRGSVYILPGRNTRVSMSNNTLLFALYRMGYRGRMTGHGFRSVASTILNEHEFRPDVIEKQLAHDDSNAVRSAYNHAEYIKERVEMMTWWGNYLGPMLRLPGA